MISVGDKVTVAAPFDKQFPETYLVAAVVDDVCTLLVDGGDVDFATEFLAATGMTGTLPPPPADDPKKSITRAMIKDALWSNADPVEAVAALFGVEG